MVSVLLLQAQSTSGMIVGTVQVNLKPGRHPARVDKSAFMPAEIATPAWIRQGPGTVTSAGGMAENS